MVEMEERPEDEMWLRRPSLSQLEVDRQRQAFDVGFPLPSELKARLSLITRLHEFEVPILVRAKIQFALIRSIRDDRPLSDEELAPIETMLEYLVSIKGAGRKEIVEIARVQPKPEKRGFFGFGR